MKYDFDLQQVKFFPILCQNPGELSSALRNADQLEEMLRAVVCIPPSGFNGIDFPNSWKKNMFFCRRYKSIHFGIYSINFGCFLILFPCHGETAWNRRWHHAWPSILLQTVAVEDLVSRLPSTVEAVAPCKCLTLQGFKDFIDLVFHYMGHIFLGGSNKQQSSKGMIIFKNFFKKVHDLVFGWLSSNDPRVGNALKVAQLPRLNGCHPCHVRWVVHPEVSAVLPLKNGGWKPFLLGFGDFSAILNFERVIWRVQK